jgi:alkanesulfonate monooxygenase SsuD/methylene tetrahydromethanopterin reductase-like flavin-dependent oxidoreductase (luciferase family)
VPHPPPRVWIGGSSEKALHRAVRYGDGWCPFFAIAHHSRINRDSGIRSVADLADKIAFIREERRARGFDGEFDINIALSANDLLTRRSIEEADRLLENLSDLESAGANWVTLKLPHPDRATWVENVQWFGEEIVARS